MLTLICGIPASGKSFLAKRLGMPVISQDTLLEELVAPDTHSACVERREAWFDILPSMLGRIRDGVALDGVFDRREERARVLERCGQLGIECQCIWVRCPPRLALARNSARALPVEEPELLGTFYNFEPPTADEGFSSVVAVDTGDIMADIYLVKNGNSVDAYGDEASLAGRTPDRTVTSEEWAAADSCARIENGQIVLGKTEAEIYEYNAAIIRNERYLRLRQCDKISPMRWNAMTDAQKQAWTQYRVDLLNIPQQSGFPWGGDIEAAPWPTKPE